MQSRKLSFVLLALGLGACTVDASTPDEVAETKQAARDRMQNAASGGDTSAGSGVTDPAAPSAGGTRPAAPPDVCLLRKWYDDGECDVWCPRGDPGDCAPSGGGGVACAEFWSPADGYCNPNDPCGPVQDEDCQKPGGGGSQPCVPPHPTPRPPDGDGKCDPKTYEEFKADPDCGGLLCPAIFSPADGKCDPKTPCDFVIDGDCAKGGNVGGPVPCDDGREPSGATCGGGSPGNPVVCPAILYADNGKCEAAPGCEASDPNDCAVVCDAIAYPANGKCEAPPGCEANDPRDCAVVCDLIGYAANGKCEAPPGCEANDPEDCPVLCPAIAYRENGKCEPPPGCERLDPDC
jgi:hypothetical protein